VPASLTTRGRSAPLPTLMVATCAALALVLAGCGGGGGGSKSTGGTAAGAGSSASASFCTDSQFLTNQSGEPGIDNFDPTQPLHPNPAMVKSYSVSLDKLAGEAPTQIKADLTTWAAFTDQLARGASQSELAAKYSEAKSAADRVQSYLSSASNNCLGSSTDTSTTGPGSTDTSTSTTGATGSLTAFCADVDAVNRDVALVQTTLSLGRGISASVFQQYLTAAQHLAAEAPPTPSNLAPDAEAIVNDLSAILKSPNDPNAFSTFIPDISGLVTDKSIDCP
jgi:hypothetical protein